MRAEIPRPSAEFRFYAELNDFLRAPRRHRALSYRFDGKPSVKDAIEAIGIPHTEVDVVLVNGESVGARHRLVGGERVAVYPSFRYLDVEHMTRWRNPLSRPTRFVLDAHLGKLARYLRLLGLDTLYQSDYDDPTIVVIAKREARTIITRDKGLLKRAEVKSGHWLRATDPQRQLEEVVDTFDLSTRVAPFTRCMHCNGKLHHAAKADIVGRLPPRVRQHFDEFVQCKGCARVYWRGSHHDRLQEIVAATTAKPTGA